MKPIEVNSRNEQHLLDTVYNYDRPVAVEKRKQRGKRTMTTAFKVGDFVRISKFRTVFEKGYTPNWTTEIFKIRKVQHNTDPVTYLLEDYQNGEIKGSFYAEELQPVRHPNVYLVEKIIRRRNGQAYVKWLGFGPEHNSWIPETDIL